MTSEESLREVVAGDSRVQFACLFGSRVTGRARPDSDWDLAVYLDPALSARERFDARLQLAGTLPANVDLVILNEAPPLLAHRALQGRELLVRDRTDYVRFFVHALGQAEDQRYFDKIHWRARARRLEAGTFGRP